MAVEEITETILVCFNLQRTMWHILHLADYLPFFSEIKDFKFSCVCVCVYVLSLISLTLLELQSLIELTLVMCGYYGLRCEMDMDFKKVQTQ